MDSINHFSFLIENTEITLFFTPAQFASYNDGISHPHCHAMHEMFILIDGELYIESDFSIIDMKNSDICIIPPLTHHSTYRTKNIPTKRISMFFTYKKNETIQTDFDFFSLICALSKKNSAPISLSADTIIINNLVNILSHSNLYDITKLNEAKIKNIFSLLFINFAENLLVEQNTSCEPYKRNVDYYLRLAKLDILLNEQLSERNRFNLDVSLISDKMFISSRQLLNIINNEYNTSLKKLNHKNRISLAKFLLKHQPKMSIAQISLLCGYSSPETLSIIFKKNYGLSPSEFRKLSLT